MNRISTKLFLLAISLVVFGASYAQLSITAQAGGLKFLGDVGQKNNTNFFSDMRMGYGLSIEYRIGKILGIGIDGMYGKLAGNDNDKSSHLNFQSQIMGGGLNLFVTQLTGVISVGIFVFTIALVSWLIIKAVLGIRVSREEEIEGLDLGEHGNQAYPDFQLVQEK